MTSLKGVKIFKNASRAMASVTPKKKILRLFLLCFFSFGCSPGFCGLCWSFAFGS